MIKSFSIEGMSKEEFVKKFNKALKADKVVGSIFTAELDGSKIVVKGKKMSATSKTIYAINIQKSKLNFTFDSEEVATLHKPFISVFVPIIKKILISIGARVITDPPS